MIEAGDDDSSSSEGLWATTNTKGGGEEPDHITPGNEEDIAPPEVVNIIVNPPPPQHLEVVDDTPFGATDETDTLVPNSDLSMEAVLAAVHGLEGRASVGGKGDNRQKRGESALENVPGLSSDFTTWSVREVARWMENDVNLPEYSPSFIKNQLTGVDLIGLTNNMLRDDLGIKLLGHRQHILRAIETLNMMR
ncbi:MAG: hypothetical protein GY721_12415, partial [Deltaproteobacteria bacterium]|nr:hypothetical protein [Deltaproteobacteria bacterium]